MLITDVYDELKEIADVNKKIEELTEKFMEKWRPSPAVLNLLEAYSISDCIYDGDTLYDDKGNTLTYTGIMQDEYGYLDDYYGCYGTAYFATHEVGTYIVVPYELN